MLRVCMLRVAHRFDRWGAIMLAILAAVILTSIFLFPRPASAQVAGGFGAAVTVHVLSNLGPIQGAQVTFTQHGKFVSESTSNASGDASFSFLNARGLYFLEFNVSIPIGSVYNLAPSTKSMTGPDPYANPCCYYSIVDFNSSVSHHDFYAYFYATPADNGSSVFLLVGGSFLGVVVLVGGVLVVRKIRTGGRYHKPGGRAS